MTARLKTNDLDTLCSLVAAALPGPTQEPETMDMIYASIPAPRPPRDQVELLVAQLVEEDEVSMYALGPRTMGNGRQWLHYRWNDA